MKEEKRRKLAVEVDYLVGIQGDRDSNILEMMIENRLTATETVANK